MISPVALNSTAMLAPLAGIARYVYELSGAFQAAAVPVEYFTGGLWSARPPQPAPSSDVSRLRTLALQVPGARWMNRYAQNRLFRAGTARIKPCLYHEPAFLAFDFDGPLVVTAHDASWVRFPEVHPSSRVRLMNSLFPRSLERADRVIVDSAFVAREMTEIFGVAPGRMRMVPLGVGRQFRPMDAAETLPVCTRHGLRHGGFVLAVGTLEPRKNLSALIDAYGCLPTSLAERFPLVVAGKAGWRHGDVDQRMAALERAGRLRVLGHVPEADLPQLYAASSLFVYPSIYEGFGLPPLEALASGVPVIVSDRASLPEVVGDVGIKVEPHDVAVLAERMSELLQDDGARASLGAAGPAQAGRFTWEQTARQTLDVYRELVPL